MTRGEMGHSKEWGNEREGGGERTTPALVAAADTKASHQFTEPRSQSVFISNTRLNERAKPDIGYKQEEAFA